MKTAVPATPEPQAEGHTRLRRAALVFLLVLGCGLAAASVVAVWARVTVLNTDRYVSTMAPIARSPAVQKAVVDRLDARITGAIDFAGLARDVLPARADVLAPAIETGAESAIHTQLEKFVASDRFGTLWDGANRRAHARVVALLTTGKSKNLVLTGNTVSLDLSSVVDTIRQRLQDRGFDRIAAAIPASVDGQIPLFSSDGFASARKGINLVKRLSVVLPLLALLALGAHVLLADSRRRGLLRVALGLAVTGLLVLAAVGVGRTAYLDAIDNSVLPRQAAADIFDALMSLLRGTVRVVVIVAVLIALLSLFAGKPARRALEVAGPRVRAATSSSPAVGWLGAHRAVAQWSVVLLGGLILVAWDNPTAVVVLIDGALIALAVWLVALLAHGGRSAPG